jgi:hypothetical protein
MRTVDDQRTEARDEVAWERFVAEGRRREFPEDPAPPRLARIFGPLWEALVSVPSNGVDAGG